jgi:phospholipase/carboxylesterase
LTGCPRGASSRRDFLAATAWLAGGALLAGCGLRLPTAGGAGQEAATLTARPGQAFPGQASLSPGTQPLGIEPTGDPLLYLPTGLAAGEPAAFVLTLHGAGGDATAGLSLLQPLADEHGLVLLAPASRGPTWDAVRGRYGPDAELIDRALAQAFATVPVDPGRVAVAGFSDGASYALGLGLANGDLFGRIVALSPGFVPPGPRGGRPAVFVAHGHADEVLPIEDASREIVPALRADGYDVTYREFAGGHTVPPEVTREAVDWLG